MRRSLYCTGGGPALIGLLGGQVDFMFDPGPAVPHVKADKLRVPAVAHATRSPVFPDTPTMAEAGTDVDVDLVQGVYAPSGTPREIIARLNREIGRIMQTAEVRATLAAIDGEAVSRLPPRSSRRVSGASASASA